FFSIFLVFLCHWSLLLDLILLDISSVHKIGGRSSLIQYILIWWMFGRNLKWWLFLSLIAWMLPPVLGFYVETQSIIGLIAFLFVLNMPSTLIQVLLLRNYVWHSRIWLFANIIGFLIFAPFIAFADI